MEKQKNHSGGKTGKAYGAKKGRERKGKPLKKRRISEIQVIFSSREECTRYEELVLESIRKALKKAIVVTKEVQYFTIKMANKRYLYEGLKEELVLKIKPICSKLKVKAEFQGRTIDFKITEKITIIIT